MELIIKSKNEAFSNVIDEMHDEINLNDGNDPCSDSYYWEKERNISYNTIDNLK